MSDFRYSAEWVDDLVDNFESQGYDHSPIAIAVDTYVGLKRAGFSEQEALGLTKIICVNFYKDFELRR